MFRALPPSGVPIKLTDIMAGIAGIFSGEKSIIRFNQKVCEKFGVSHAMSVSSGRAGLSLLCKVLQKRSPERNEVLIPAFTSFSVPSAVVNAGLKISLYDIDPETLSPVSSSLRSAITDKTLCIIVCHLFGYPADLDEVQRVANERKIPIIDDAAQAMGATYKGKPVGTFGIAGLFSLSRGKNITAVDGGVIVTNDESVASELSTQSLQRVGITEYLVILLKAVALSFLLHPRCYWLPRSIPSLNIGASVFDPRFTVRKVTSFQAGIALKMLERLDKINGQRKKIAERHMRLLPGNDKIQFPKTVSGGEPVFLRFPIKSHGIAEKTDLGVVKSYPLAIHHIVGIERFLVTKQDYPGATALAEQTLTLPTHCYVTDEDCRNIAASLS